MGVSFKKLWSDYGIGAVIVLLLLAYGVNLLANYLVTKGKSGNESFTHGSAGPMSGSHSGMPGSSPAVAQEPQMTSGPQAAYESNNEVYSAVSGVPTPSMEVPTSCSAGNIQNPSDLLPKDTNSEWAQLNPSGKGELANINLLKAGYHIGIDTIGQTLRNANQQIRSEPANPQLYVGPWNLSTIEPDFMRTPLELGQGIQ
jgi:hypothetical protein